MIRRHLAFGALIMILAFGFTACAGSGGYTDPRTRKEADAIRDLGKEYFNFGRYSNALRELLKAEKMNPGDYLIHNYLGLTYQKKKRYDDAVRHFKRAIKLNPDYGPAANNLGSVYLEMEDWDAAIATITPLVEESRYEIYLTPHLAQLNLGSAYFQKKEYGRAETYFREALQHYLDGFTKDIHYFKIAIGLSRTFRASGRASEAIPILQDAIETVPTMPVLHYELGKAYQETGDTARAVAAFSEVVAMAPDSEPGRASKREIKIIGKGD